MFAEPQKKRILYGLEIAYHGGHFSGWQWQPRHRSVQSEIEKALGTIFRKKVSVVAASRTDSGVHAEGQFAVFALDIGEKPLDNSPRFLESINALTDPSISVSAVFELPPDFKLRTHVSSKIYRYQIWNAPFPNCFLASTSYHYRKKLDLGAMNEASQAFVGTHDFKAFSASGCGVKTTTRTICRVWIETAHEEKLILMRFHGTGFLQHMVRIMVGTLVEVGRGRFEASEMESILTSKDRRVAGPTAPPQGLFLEKIFFSKLTSC